MNLSAQQNSQITRRENAENIVQINHYKVMDDLEIRNYVMQVRKEYEEEQMPINRLKRYMRHRTADSVLKLLNEEEFSTNELHEALEYLNSLKINYPFCPTFIEIVCDTINEKLNSNEYILK